MRCPRCGSDFEATVEQCFTCGWDFSQNPADFTPRTSRLTILSLVLGILCVFTLYLPLLPSVILSILALRSIRKSRGKLTGERLAMAGILIPFLSIPVFIAIGTAVWSKDAGPVPNEFTEADLVQVKPENEVTWSILCQLNDEKDDPNGAPAIGFCKADCDLLDGIMDSVKEPNFIDDVFRVVRENADEIEYLWNQSEKGREVIKELNTYDQIADFSETHLETEFSYATSLKLLTQVNYLHVLLLLEKGDDLQACHELIAFDSVFRKYGISARSLISKLVCYAVFALDFKAADLLAQHPEISEIALLLLDSHFNHFKKAQISLENCVKYEYLVFKNTMSDYFAKPKKMSKHNSACRYYDAFCRNYIVMEKGKQPFEECPISVWPWENPVFPKVSLDIEEISNQSYNLYFLYNPIGSMQMVIMLPALEKVIEIRKKIEIYDDLFRWVLARRLGREGSLAARAYGEEYVVDVEKGLVYSPGPDGEAFTKDDIKLRISPAVLGLTEQQAVQESTTEITE